jgi:hypothetical protein
MESKSNRGHAEGVLLWMILVVLSLWGVVATVLTVRRDGLRRVRTAPIVRPPEPRR